MSSSTSTTQNLRSLVWQYFTRDKSGQTAQCQKCKKSLKSTGGSTKNLHDHLQKKHCIFLNKTKTTNADSSDEDNSDTVPEPKQSRSESSGGAGVAKSFKAPGPMDKFLSNENAMAATVARMAACDGVPFSLFTKSADMRRIMARAGYDNLPRSGTGIQSVVLQQGNAIRSIIKSELQCRRKKGTAFSLSFDEWTSVRNRRYMVINVHEFGEHFWCVGLVRVSGTMPAEKCIDLLKERLLQFDLNLDRDIVGICTDGASVMTKVGKLISAEHQLCWAHGVHLAVHDVIYKRRAVSGTAVECRASACDEADCDENDEADMDSVDDGGGMEATGFAVEEFAVFTATDAVAELSDTYNNVVSKVRRVVKLFRKSPTKNDDVLQVYVKQEHGKELALLLDVPTRWNSLHTMLSRFLQLRSSIHKAMIDLKLCNEFQITDAEFETVAEMVAVLEPVALVVEVLSRRDINLVSAEAALTFCVMQLNKQPSELAKTMAMTLTSRISERYSVHSNVLRYLHSGSSEVESEFSEAGDITAAQLLKFIQRLLARLDVKHDQPCSG